MKTSNISRRDFVKAGGALVVSCAVPGAVTVALNGVTVKGATRWLDIGVTRIQPSELMKLFAVLYAADYTVRKGVVKHTFRKAFLPMFAVMALAVLLTLETLWLPWGWHAANAAWLVCATILAYGIGSRFGTLGPVIHLFTSRERMQRKVRLRAEQGFARHAISQTRERTGVLILLSILERQVYVLPDRPLAQQVPVEQWSQIVQVAVERLKTQDIAGGLCEAIEQCGRLLAEVCPPRPGDNPNELPNQVVTEQ